MKYKLLIALIALTLCSCSDSDGATRYLENMGFKDIETQGWSWFDCSSDGKNDFWKTEFTAVSSATGAKVEGVVCEGLFKGKTHRID